MIGDIADHQRAAGAWLELAGAAVLVAGAGGLGRAIVEGFAALGSRVIAVDANESRVRDVAAACDLERNGGGFAVADLRDPEACRAVVARARDSLGRLDAFVHAIGINNRKPVLEYTDAEWREILDVNLTSAFSLGQAAGRIMCEQRGGKLVFLSSVSGLLAHRRHAPYAASKGGINQMLRVMAVEWAGCGVTVNAVAPGYVETPLTTEYLERPGVRDELASLVPAGRLGGIEDVVGPTLFLASRLSAFVTGQVLYVDGGRTLV